MSLESQGRIGIFWNSGKLLSNGLKNDRLPHVPTVLEEVHFPWLMASPLCTMPFKIFFFSRCKPNQRMFPVSQALFTFSLISGGALPCFLMIVHILKPFWLFSAATAVFQKTDTGERITSPPACSRRFPWTSAHCVCSPVANQVEPWPQGFRRDSWSLTCVPRFLPLSLWLLQSFKSYRSLAEPGTRGKAACYALGWAIRQQAGQPL